MQTLTFSEFKKRYDINLKAKEGSDGYIGSGGYGSVYKAYSFERNQFVAVKKSAITKNLLDEVEKARTIPHHANIARYNEGFRIDSDAEDFDVAILQYYEEGNLNQLITQQQLTDNQFEQIVLGILNGLDFLHNGLKTPDGKLLHLIHRDLKPQNILISKYRGQYIPLITDFGISKMVSDNEHSVFSNSTGVGTIAYKAPEQIKNTKIKVNLDLWAFGVVLFKMLTGRLPFASDLDPNTDAYYIDISKKIESANLDEVLAQLKGQTQKYQDVVQRCLVRDIDKRAQTAKELMALVKEIPQRIAQAQTYLKAQQFEQALPLFETLLKDDPYNKDAQQGRDNCLKKIADTPPPPKPHIADPPTDNYQRPPVQPTPSVREYPKPTSKPKPIPWKQWAMACGVLVVAMGVLYKVLAPQTPDIDSVVQGVAGPTLNADSLFVATKIAFLEKGLDKTTAFKQFKKAVYAKPTLANDARKIFMDKAEKFKGVSPELGKEYEQLAQQFR